MKKAIVAITGIIAIGGLAAYLQNVNVLWALILLIFVVEGIDE